MKVVEHGMPQARGLWVDTISNASPASKFETWGTRQPSSPYWGYFDMRGLAIAGLAILLAHLSWAEKRVTVDALRQTIASRIAAHANDNDLAQQIGAMELRERLTARSVDAILANWPVGPKTREALLLLCDTSVFLDPPPSELPRKPAPDAVEQQRLLHSAADFAEITLTHLPDFLAMQATKSFDNTGMFVTRDGRPGATMQYAGTFYQEITYHKGREVATLHPDEDSILQGEDGLIPGLASKGEFGPVLAMIFRDSAHGTVAWNHWEETPAGLVGVFHYEVPESASHFDVNFCCVLGKRASKSYHGFPAYHGSLSVDPATGTILRLTIDAELGSHSPIMRSAMSVNYGLVEIIGERQSYICPIHSVTLSLENTGHYTILRVNDVSFSNYRHFGSKHRILPISPQGR